MENRKTIIQPNVLGRYLQKYKFQRVKQGKDSVNKWKIYTKKDINV